MLGGRQNNVIAGRVHEIMGARSADSSGWAMESSGTREAMAAVNNNI